MADDLTELRKALDEFKVVSAALSCSSSSCSHSRDKGGQVVNGPCRCYPSGHPLRNFVMAATRLRTAALQASLPIRDRSPGAGPATRRGPLYHGMTPTQAEVSGSVPRKRIVDDDGKEVCAGDRIHFGYGIPGVAVHADIIERDGRLIALTPGHNPSECRLDELRGHVVNFWKLPAKQSQKEVTSDLARAGRYRKKPIVIDAFRPSPRSARR